MAVAAAAAFVDAPNVIAQPKVQWRMSTGWTAALDVLQGAAQRLAKVVDETSGGRFRIEVFPGGQIMPTFGCFDAASQGTIESVMATPYYWRAKEPAFEWFATIPFGMNPEGMAAWYYQGDGLKLMEETYAPFNLVPRPGLADAPQMAGWFRKKITGGMVQEEDHHERRLQGGQEGHGAAPRRQGHPQRRGDQGPHPGEGDLRRPPPGGP